MIQAVDLKKININIDKEKLAKFGAENKKRLLIGAGIIFVLLLVLVIVKVKLSSDQAQNLVNTVSTNKSVPLDKMYNYLPATKRTLKDHPQGQDPFSTTMTLQGIIDGGKDGNLAIIQAEGTVYVVSKGMSVADVWQVKDINKSTVILFNGDKKINLKFGGSTIVPQANSEQPATGSGVDQTDTGISNKQDGSSTKEGGNNGG